MAAVIYYTPEKSRLAKVLWHQVRRPFLEFRSEGYSVCVEYGPNDLGHPCWKVWGHQLRDKGMTSQLKAFMEFPDELQVVGYLGSIGLWTE